jgi:hypothetical protein
MWNNWNEYVIKAFPKDVSNEVVGVLEILPYNKKLTIQSKGENIEILPEYQNGKFYIQDKMYDFNNMIYDCENIENYDLTYNFFTFRVSLIDEFIKIPYRIYINEVENDIIDKLSGTQKIILYCLYSRNYNGYIRQKYIEKLLDKKEYFITPYVIEMIGEYVPEIMVLLDEYIEENKTNIMQYICYNIYKWRDISGRVSSNYLYHKEKYPKYKEYIGAKLVKKINKYYNDYCIENKIYNMLYFTGKICYL